MTLGEASNVDLVAGSEGIGCDYVADIESRDVFETEFLEVTLNRNASLLISLLVVIIDTFLNGASMEPD